MEENMNWKRFVASIALAVIGTAVAPAFADTVTTTTTTTTTTTPSPVVVAPPPVAVAPPPVVVPPPVVAARPVYTVTYGPWLNVRTAPNGWVIGSVPPGTPLTLVGPTSGPWGYVATPMGYTGWAFLPYTYRTA
jgi:hypothetical protein